MIPNKTYKTLLTSVEGPVVTVTINREKKLNTLNLQVLSELEEFLEGLIASSSNKNKEQSLRVLLLTGAGNKAFIAGADIQEMDSMPLEEVKKLALLGQKVSLLFENLPFPSIACVDGYTLGGGLEMAMSCDFIYATESSIFGLPEVTLGLIPGFGGTQRLPRLIGLSRAKEMIYTGKKVNASEAQQMGLVLKIFPTKKELLLVAANCLGPSPQKASREAISKAKKAIQLGNDGKSLSERLKEERDQFVAIFPSEDRVEGFRAFFERRPPRF